MVWKIRNIRFLFVLIFTIILCGCTISYGFRGGSIDYTKIKTIKIPPVQNRASLVYPPLAANFTQQIQDFYSQRTNLTQIDGNADIELVCEISGYDIAPMSISSDNFASRTSFVLQVRVKYTNAVNEKESFERTFKAQRDFDRNTQFTQVRDQLLEEMTEELIKQIYNATIENW